MICRPRDHLNVFTQRYPGAWSKAGDLVRERGTGGIPDWPSWCFLPMAGSYGTEIPVADRAFDLRWMPPIAVNADGGDMPAVIRKVR